ncbi:dihydrofolate reductase [Marinifilum sp. N1E240]|uniref:NAD(P)-dependent oxidoreductase n=1 Tax=Marinifilum sp. N1E240 TaxID=2608082 RepID=UPI00128DAB3A|nr:NAD(P)-dependent oxidoreductase [Marinifilum sp. N1E240]MPQ47305.1 dihydrofolate reductase [Marinifilum sp. N1E240]
MKEKILVSYSVPKEGLVELNKHFELIYPVKEFFTNDELIALVPDCVALLSIFNREVPKKLISAGKNLKMISNYGVGFNNIDIATANQQNILVCNTPDAVCEPTAELCLALMLSLGRRVAECHHALISNPDFEWGVMKNLGNTLKGKTLGIVGMGKIGKSIAQKAEVFGMKILYHNRKPKLESKYKYAGFEELLSKSDLVSLNCPFTEQTHHLIGVKELKLMKNSAFLINTARGPVVDEQALVDALKSNTIAGAALDVFENEPKIHPELLKMNNAVLVPHIGTATIETRIEMACEASENIISYLIHNKEKNRVN